MSLPIQPTLNQWQGCLAGVLVGDCLGYPYEVIRFKKQFPSTIEFIEDDLEKIKIGQLIPYVPYERKSKKPVNSECMLTGMSDSVSQSAGTKSFRKYTDDTSMTITFVKFLIDSNKPMDFVDLARRFSAEFIVDEPKSRGYGPGVKKLLKKFQEVNFKDIYQYAPQHFNGTGSMGNGSGMRIAPVALYTINDPNLLRLVEITVDSCVLTHTHPEGIFGGIFQALAVRQALLFGAKKDSGKPSAIEILDAFEADFKSILTNSDTLKRVSAYQSGYQVYQDRINVIRKFLEGGPSSWNVESVKKELGNKVVSSKSIPTALFCFLASFDDIDFINTENHFQRTITLAFALGGDTDTIGGMTGAICGAYLGLDGFPNNFVNTCEASGKVLNVAEKLYQKCNSN